MYFAVAALLILATASPLTAYELPSTGSGELAKEFQDILDLIPLNDALEITRVYTAKDVEFRTMLRVIGSNDTRKLLEFVEGAPEVKEVLQYVQDHGLDVYYMIDKMNKAFDLGPFVPLTMSNGKITGGVRGYMKDVASTMPLDAIIELVKSKIQKPGPFNDLVNFILQPRFVAFYDAVSKNEHYLVLEELAGELGVEPNYFQTYLPLLISIYTIVHFGMV